MSLDGDIVNKSPDGDIERRFGLRRSRHLRRPSQRSLNMDPHTIPRLTSALARVPVQGVAGIAASATGTLNGSHHTSTQV